MCSQQCIHHKRLLKPEMESFGICQGNRFNPVHGRLLVACAWVYALFFACSPLARWGAYGPEPYGTACCIDWHVSNRQSMARSYTLALFVFCYILPCCVIVASYTGILVTVRASQKALEQHVSRRTHVSNLQTIIVKVRRYGSGQARMSLLLMFLGTWQMQSEAHHVYTH